jgi:hypothetical protein
VDDSRLETSRLEVVIRPMHSGDHPFIFSTWRNSLYYDLDNQDKTKAKAWFGRKSKQIKKILNNAQTRIACLKESPDFIVGYSVNSENHLDYVYVRADYREEGIGTLLVPKNVVTFTDETTKIGRAILEKKNKEKHGNSSASTNSESQA